MNILCLIGLHSWTPGALNYIDPVTNEKHHTKNMRFCCRCGRAEAI